SWSNTFLTTISLILQPQDLGRLPTTCSWKGNRAMTSPVQYIPKLPLTRRQALGHFANGFGMVALAGLLAEEAAAATPNPLAVRPPQYPARAKRIIFLFMSGGPSHVDTFDPKPRLDQDNGKPLPFEMPKLVRTKTGNLLKSPWKFSKHGQCGTEVSELFPQ